MSNERGNGFIYHIPGVDVAAPSKVFAALPHLDGAALSDTASIERCDGCLNGPAGVGGAFFGIGKGPTPQYKPDEQVWKCCKGGAVWVGWAKGNPPGPNELKRKRMLGGATVRLADGKDWIVPRLAAFPFVFEWNTDGEMVDVIHEAYRDVYHRVNDANSRDVPYGQAVEIVADALALNYRIGLPEIVALGLLGNLELQEAWGVLNGREVAETVKAALADAEKNDDPARTPDG